MKQKKSKTNNTDSFLIPIRSLAPGGDIIVKRISLFAGALSTSAGGVIPVTNYAAGDCTSGAEWSAFSSRYQQYRVKAMRVTFTPLWPRSAIAGSNHFSLAVSDALGGAYPSTAAQVFSDERARLVMSCDRFVATATNSKNPNALLWNSTSLTMPLANNFSVAVASTPSTTLGGAAQVFSVSQEWIVEFRGSQ